ncbi:hypothetical protein FQR65_LT19358 [Abscondita terminalis]|nr:hypothetical protein FQR65_LT19358 [Abscondita terminalis]
MVSFWKVRGNYAEVGGTADPYQLEFYYKYAGIFNNSIVLQNSQTFKANPYLKPQRSKEFEFGTEAHFLKGRLTFDAAYYKTRTFNQIIELPISAGSGVLTAAENAGRVDNEGIEVQIGATPVRTQNFSWNVDVNWSKNKNKVVDLKSGITNYNLTSVQGGASVNATVGQTWGAIRGSDYTYLNGEKVVDSKGFYVLQGKKVIGIQHRTGLRGISEKEGYFLQTICTMQASTVLYEELQSETTEPKKLFCRVTARRKKLMDYSQKSSLCRSGTTLGRWYSEPWYSVGLTIAATVLSSGERVLLTEPRWKASLGFDFWGIALYGASQQEFIQIDNPSVNANNYRFFVQQWSETTYTDEVNYNLITRNQPRYHFQRMYVYALHNFKKAQDALVKEVNDPAVADNKWRNNENVFLFVGKWLLYLGDVPYTEALKALEEVMFQV